mmetsp:Transcript_21534/g.32906  ORF Transcript_21534/g.32906 Transcript_21534/m.32906 type:complete len:85 (-) Transcript_21534:226-480(-)|eukprot:CAMPEP_0118683018 /NCGR_PEP_ID=MMETSP0800-20121206/5803_1 /TAXON_ID=210618 ORGANISM="Striatella unipunctata, Strain CCMP2910" /NCGR_SAMPLE_ID=MMETSP0800 /ASSEMBLY_ACC=CAM_ASM_000638 /LENGTH=84 /DNA_ID=CAMNT_0006579463 /DNA_START=67 /DNA_END=321 /DNA_ORIENTATION=-
MESKPVVSSEDLVSHKMQKGLEEISLYTASGLVVGGLVSVVLARGGGSGAARKAIAGLSGGAAFGVGWARCSMDLESLVKNNKP